MIMIDQVSNKDRLNIFPSKLVDIIVKCLGWLGWAYIVSIVACLFITG